MELYHNQVTRAQGPFSLRMFHRSWGIMMIQENISAPSTVLDFPTREAFERELTSRHYDIVGISSIIVNVGKVREMCKIVRRLSPHSEIVVGGHVAAIPGLDRLIDADHIVRGEGVSWMRRHLGEDHTAPVRHPNIASAFGHRIMGIRVPGRKTAATVIPSVGCPMGCNFCTTSAFFGGKGRFENFYETGNELFEVMSRMEASMGMDSFFVMDENFLLNRKRAMQLLEQMKQHGKSWELYVFSSANAIRKYTMDELVELGIAWIWMGLESPHSNYSKLEGTDTLQLTRELRAHGIRILGSTIVGLEHHTPENITEELEFAISHGTDFHQFMLYTPLPGTPLHAELGSQGRLIESDIADAHGQHKFNWLHPAISADQSKRLLDWAFSLDFERNGPSLYRICRTMLEGWKRHRSHPDQRVRKRFEREAAALRTGYSALLWAMEKRLKHTNESVSRQIAALRAEVTRECGSMSAVVSALAGPLLLWTTRREEKRLAAGITYEPPTLIERRNWAEA
jgi:radical SAM superfamily enzyme YgiQ (UPF0313 family)